MSEKKKQEYTTGGLKNRQDVENALASAEYRPSQEVTDAASDLKQWQANRPGDYESAYQGRIDGLMEDLLDRKEFSYSYGADPLYRQYAQLYTQNAQNASADVTFSGEFFPVDGFLAEGKEGELPDHETRTPPRDADDRQKGQRAGQPPSQPHEKAAQDEPENIAESTHRSLPHFNELINMTAERLSTEGSTPRQDSSAMIIE